MKPRRPILRLRNAPSSGERLTNADTTGLSADKPRPHLSALPASALAASPGTAPENPAPARPAFGWVPAVVTWRDRMAAEVEALAGGHAPAVFGPLRAGGPWMPFTVGLRDAFMACYPEADVDRVRRLFARVCGSDGYLRALARDLAREAAGRRPVERAARDPKWARWRREREPRFGGSRP